MKQTNLFAFALLFAACHEEPVMTFGLNFRVIESNTPSEQVSSSCHPPGAHSGETSGFGSWTTGEAPPHLFVEAAPDAEENVYRVQVYIASERDEDGIWWKPSEVLAERTYDSTFGESGEQDNILVDFEGEPYTVEVSGLPPAATCP